MEAVGGGARRREWAEMRTERGMWGEEGDGRERGNGLGEASRELHVFGVKSEIWT